MNIKKESNLLWGLLSLKGDYLLSRFPNYNNHHRRDKV